MTHTHLSKTEQNRLFFGNSHIICIKYIRCYSWYFANINVIFSPCPIHAFFMVLNPVGFVTDGVFPQSLVHRIWRCLKIICDIFRRKYKVNRTLLLTLLFLPFGSPTELRQNFVSFCQEFFQRYQALRHIATIATMTTLRISIVL